MISCVILAAGKSIRMGNNNKLLLHYNGKEIIKHVVEKTINQGFKEIVIVLGWQYIELRKKLESYPVKFIYNPDYSQGQSTSLKKALSVLSEQTQGAFFVLGDQPLINKKTFIDLKNKFLEIPNHIIVPFYKGQRGNPVVIPHSMFSKLKQIEGDKGAREIILKSKKLYKMEVEDPGIVIDIDTPQEYKELIKQSH